MLDLIYVFFYVGLFTIGGGMVAIPLIQQEVVSRGWISIHDFYGMVAIAESTPGPIGINIATYVGYNQFGIFGALITTISFIIPSFFIISVLSELLKKYRNSLLVINWFFFLKAAIVGLILYALVNVSSFAFTSSHESSQIDIKSIILFLVLGAIYYFFRKKPWIVIIFGAVFGIILL